MSHIISLPVEAAAKAVGLSRRYLDGAIAKGDLIAHKAGNKTLIRLPDLEAWVESMPVVEKRSA